MGSWHQKQGISLEKINEVYEAEVITILEGLEQALKSPMAEVAPRIHICLDNLEVARNASGIPKSSSQKAFRQFRDLTKGWVQTVQWVPSHTRIKGNKLANQEAKKYAKRPQLAKLNLHKSIRSAK